MPFFLYMALVLYSVGILENEFNEMIYADMTLPENQERFKYIRPKCYLTTSIATLLLTFFSGLEGLQIIETGIFVYMKDYWNFIDMC